MYKNVDPVGFKTLIETDPAAALIDVRTPAEFARGSISGARNIELSTLPTQLSSLDPETPLALYCLSGARSAQACAYLAQHGYRELYHLDGGLAA